VLLELQFNRIAGSSDVSVRYFYRTK